MLKGQLYVDIEFIGGTMIFIILAFTIFLVILLPLRSSDYNMAKSAEKIRAMEFANLVKSRMSETLGNGKGDIERDKLLLQAEKGLSNIGLADNYVLVENIISGEIFIFNGESGEGKHEVFATMSTPYIAVENKTQIVMKVGKEYIIHVYRFGGEGKTFAFDIYQDYICSQSTRMPPKTEKYHILNCDDISDLEKSEVDATDMKNSMIAPVVNGVKDEEIARIIPKNQITADNLVISGMRFGKFWECNNAGENIICFRLAGDFVFPARIHTQSDVNLVADREKPKT